MHGGSTVPSPAQEYDLLLKKIILLYPRSLLSVGSILWCNGAVQPHLFAVNVGSLWTGPYKTKKIFLLKWKKNYSNDRLNEGMSDRQTLTWRWQLRAGTAWTCSLVYRISTRTGTYTLAKCSNKNVKIRRRKNRVFKEEEHFFNEVCVKVLEKGKKWRI